MIGRHIAALAVAGMMTLAPLAANAAYDSTTLCLDGSGQTIGGRFAGVDAAIVSAGFVNEADRTNMRGKLLDAYTAAMTLKNGVPTKYADAITKLQNISDTAVALAGAAKPKLVSAVGITDTAYLAQQCLSSPL